MSQTAGKVLALGDAELLRTRAYIDGAWVDADSGETFEVLNPATGEVLAEVPRCGAAETRRAIEAAEAAQPEWRAKTAKLRAHVLRRWHDLLLENIDDLALLLTSEQGKPLAESKGEIAYAASFLEWFGEEAKRAYGDVIPPPADGMRIVVTKEPIGVTAGITPWNFPAAMITRKAAPALAAGCAMIVKPAEQTPLSALALAELAERAGVPRGILSIVTGSAADAPSIGGEMTSNPIVRKLGFTGSTEVGKLLMAQCAGQVKKVSLELGGNAPFLVFDDCDLDAAVAGAIVCKFRNSGQTCISANRIYVQDSIHDAFVERLTAAMAALRVGPGTDDRSNVGPLIDEDALAKVERHVVDAQAHGAALRLGGGRHALGGTYFQPTLLTGITSEMAMTFEETFGPVAGITRFREEQEAIEMANDTPYGLAAYFYSRDIGRIWRVAERLETGIVGINTGFISNKVAPFGGVKESGIGREGSKYGIEEWLEIKYLAMGGV
ncbi:MAG: succinate-semialdehyde dehydrogenase / glutarate-semialdehyde dehydrogenase [Gaiellales bacterium]|nr:succinate-semialdehyde dehydrogenase / glutarate-semialdehyde dehydrogenase [Gaiellales bacterium]